MTLTAQQRCYLASKTFIAADQDGRPAQENVVTEQKC